MRLVRMYIRRLRTARSRIHLVDKCLIVFMFTLLLQSAYSLFFYGDGTQEINTIDVIVRTASASIFGYFLSANFIRHGSMHTRADIHIAEAEKEAEAEDTEERSKSAASRIQILTATAIGMFCLLTLLLLRNISPWNSKLLGPETAATIAQFRDFVSGCVGFLIGCPTDNGGKTKQ